MKKITLHILLLFTCYLFSGQLNAQDGYTYTLAHNGGYSFTVQAVPNASTNNFATSVQSYGFTITLPDGVTIDTGSATSLGGAGSATFFDGTNVAQPTIDGYLVTETLGSPVSLPAPSAATNSNMYTFTVNGSPTSGEIKILENNSTLATTVTPLKSFMQADVIDNGMAEFVNVVDPNAAAVSGMSTFNFLTLSVEEENELLNFSIYPNPATNIVQVQMLNSIKINQFELLDISGKRVLTQLSAENTFDVSKLHSGIYIVYIQSEDIKITKKLIIE